MVIAGGKRRCVAIRKAAWESRLRGARDAGEILRRDGDRVARLADRNGEGLKAFQPFGILVNVVVDEYHLE